MKHVAPNWPDRSFPWLTVEAKRTIGYDATRNEHVVMKFIFVDGATAASKLVTIAVHAAAH